MQALNREELAKFLQALAEDDATLTAPNMTVREQQKVSGHVKVDSLMQYHDVTVEEAAARSKAALAF